MIVGARWFRHSEFTICTIFLKKRNVMKPSFKPQQDGLKKVKLNSKTSS